jgi:ABC-type bacteriocin/lantibiotic exporter with double-glycine peptidase domain
MSSIQGFRQKSTLGRSMALVSSSDRVKLILVAILQIGMSGLDLLGVALVGMLGAIAITGIESGSHGTRVSHMLELLGLSDKSLQVQALIIGLSAALILVIRTLLSIIFIRKTLLFLSRRAANLTTSLLSKLINQPINLIQQRSTQENLFAITSGVNTVVVGILGTTVTIVSDTAILIVMSVGLFVVDPTIAVSTYLLFGAIALILYKTMHTKARAIGVDFTRLSIQSSEKIVEVLDSFRENVVKNRRGFYIHEIQSIRDELAETSAEIQFLPNVSKYVIETSVVVGALVLGGVQFSLQDAKHAVATLSVFLAAGTRIAPAILRIQQGAIQIRGSLGSAESTFNLIDTLASVPNVVSGLSPLDREHTGFIPECSIRKMKFSYSNTEREILSIEDLTIYPGESIGLVGTSGAGKSTLADILLGVLEPQRGSVKISGKNPLESFQIWPGAVAYVPQNVSLRSASISANISAGFLMTENDEHWIWRCLELAQLADFVQSLPLGLETQIGENGTKLSGGQRQRIGIARALFTNPKLIVFDEATSSLDTVTENEISKAINELRGKTTLVIIAHRLSTIRDTDRIVYIEEGQIVATGNYFDLSKRFPDFFASQTE